MRINYRLIRMVLESIDTLCYVAATVALVYFVLNFVAAAIPIFD